MTHIKRLAAGIGILAIIGLIGMGVYYSLMLVQLEVLLGVTLLILAYGLGTVWLGDD